MINPLWAAALRRHWPIAGAVMIFVVFLAVNLIWFKPTAKRYDDALTQASKLGLAFDPERAAPALPPRLFALIGDNSLPESVANETGGADALTAELLAGLTTLAVARDIEVLSTEPGRTTNQPKSVQVRAHLRMRCGYQDYVAWLDDLAHGDKLVSIDQFSLSALPDGRAFIEVWVSRFILKRTKGSG